jgi:hypothetical protein
MGAHLLRQANREAEAQANDIPQKCPEAVIGSGRVILVVSLPNHQ